MKPSISPLKWLILILAGGASFLGALRISSGHAPPDVAEVPEALARRHVPAVPADAARPAIAAPQAPPATEAAPAADEATLRIATGVPQSDPFQSRSWLPPPPPMAHPAASAVAVAVAVAAPAPAPPMAPALPFSFIGQMESGAGVPKVFLANRDALMVVAAGDLIDQIYRVDAITSAAVVLTYLPLMQQQSITLTGAAR